MTKRIPAGQPIAFPGDADAIIRAHLAASIETKKAVVSQCMPDIVSAAQRIAECMHAGGKLMLCGNGGSAADSQHIAAEFVSTLDHRYPRSGLAAIALTTDSSLLTASANDFGFEGIFDRQVQALGHPGDVLIGISTSGNSVNVLNAVAEAVKAGIATIGLTGGHGGKIDTAADICIRVPSRNTQHIQESHIAIGHIICDLVERSLFDGMDKP